MEEVCDTQLCDSFFFYCERAHSSPPPVRAGKNKKISDINLGKQEYFYIHSIIEKKEFNDTR